MLVTLVGIVILVKELQPSNSDEAILVTLVGIVTLVKELQPSNTDTPTLVTLDGIIILVKELQFKNAEPYIILQFLLIEHDLIYLFFEEIKHKYGFELFPK